LDKKSISSRFAKASSSLKGKANLDLYNVVKTVSTVPMKGLFNTEINGLENIPETGPVIIAANHRSFIDSIFLPFVIPRKLTFVAKAEYFDSIKTRWFFKATGQIPIRRDSSSSGAGALLSAKEILDAGEVFGIYPEGSRTRDGFLHRGHTGVARLALDSQAVLIPVGLIGTENVQSTNEKIPRFGKKVTVNIGKPINVEKYRNESDKKLALRNLTDELMYEIFELCKYGYVDTYVRTIEM
jgi:1-acyl-sn-glycerol-3-phosphate acyltransferase